MPASSFLQLAPGGSTKALIPISPVTRATEYAERFFLLGFMVQAQRVVLEAFNEDNLHTFTTQFSLKNP